MSFSGSFNMQGQQNQGSPRGNMNSGLNQGYQLPSVFPGNGNGNGNGNGLSSIPQNQPMSGLSRQGWNDLVAANTGPGVNAAQAAAMLNPSYLSQREMRNGVYNGVYNQGSYNGMNNQGSYNAMNNQGGYNATNNQGGSPRGNSRLGNLSYLEGMQGAQSFRAGTTPERTDTVLDLNQATTLSAAQAANSPKRMSNQSSPQNRDYFVSEDVDRIAAALGLPVDGDKQLKVQMIRNRLNEMNYQQQSQFAGGLSPRSQSTFNRGFMTNQ